jgi:transposase
VDVPATSDWGPGQLGIDLGLKTTATMPNREEYDGLRALRCTEERLVVAQRARKNKRAQTLHTKAKIRRLDGSRKLSTKLARENKQVTNGNVSAPKLAKIRMAKLVRDAG